MRLHTRHTFVALPFPMLLSFFCLLLATNIAATNLTDIQISPAPDCILLRYHFAAKHSSYARNMIGKSPTPLEITKISAELFVIDLALKEGIVMLSRTRDMSTDLFSKLSLALAELRKELRFEGLKKKHLYIRKLIQDL